MQVCVQTPFDELTFRLHARLVSIGVNTSALPIMPWGKLFFAPGEIDGVSSATCLPKELLFDHSHVWESILQPFGGRRLTLSQVRKEVGSRLKGLISLSRTFAFEWEFLNVVAPAKSTEKVRAMIFNSLPNEGADMTINESVAKLDAARRSDLVVASSSELQNEVEGIRSIVLGLQEGSGPTQRQLGIYSGFFKMCLKRMEYFVSVSVPRKDACTIGKVKFDSAMKSYGLPALTTIMNKLKDQIAQGEPNGLKDFQSFRTFGWVMSDEVRDITSAWIRTALQSDMKCHSKAITDEVNGDASGILATNQNAADARLVSLPAQHVDSSSSSSAGASKRQAAPAVNVMSFFTSKSK